MDAIGVVQRLGSGKFIEDLNLALTEVAERVVLTDTKGTVTVMFALEKFPGEPAVIVREAIKSALPVPKARGATFFALGTGVLERNDPRKPQMEFRVLDEGTGDLRRPEETEHEVRRVIENVVGGSE